ncbi:helix-turn-helix domain-containing protein [Catellatospora citrea]|uniref:Transcriptional regulator n=1 Tax=Catellatospora citrea TaxID=53366 RepID=A0A8J3KA66_9ACTN|nr:helix-turn-helix transcriptional regulator [Catellatospora citrea]GIF99257.1 transcriptional regulator [Catellatospora citrea]
MTRGENPAVARLRLRHALRSARDSSDLTQEQVASSLEWSLSKVIRIENGTVRMTITDMRALLQLYGILGADAVSELEALARIARTRAWWAELGEIAPKFSNYIGLEEGASQLSFYQLLVIPGLLQTEAYARSVLPAGHLTSPVDGEDFITIRMRRQERVLERQDPPQIHAVLDESTLRRTSGGVATQREQLHHLIGLGSRPNIHLQVMPFSAGLQVLEPAFVVMAFPYGPDHDVVYLEFSNSSPAVQDRGQVLDKEEEVAPYRETFSRLTSAALDEAKSLAYIAKVAGELR